MTLAEMGVTLRPMRPEDQAFVLDGWIRSWRVSPWAGTVRNDRVFEVTRATIAGLAERGAEILVAEVVAPESGPRLIGFVAHEAPDVLHYVYVKRRGFRGLGIGRALVAAVAPTPGRFTHRTQHCGWLLDDGWRWDPVPARTETIRG